MAVADRRKRERMARREAILKAARGVLMNRGVRGTTTKEIAEQCELSEATLFFYFQSKDEILLSLLFESIEFWARGLEALAARQLPPAGLLDGPPHETAGRMRVSWELEPAWCKGCDICVKFCPERCLVLNERQLVELTDLDSCTGCRMCEWLCPDFAITVRVTPESETAVAG